MEICYLYSHDVKFWTVLSFLYMYGLEKINVHEDL